ncbi:MAG: hypothetical protein JNL50_00560 [Phycisphaerae bacterium]|nr:hypothetical protein [Phycisphaerae bacterium]
MSDPHHAPNPAPYSSPDAQRVRAAVARVRARAKQLLVLRALAVLAATAIVLVLTIALLDYFIQLPGGLRLSLLVIALLTLIATAARSLIPALRFAPALPDVALRLERTHEAKAAGLAGILASGLDLAESAPPAPDDAMRSASIHAAASRLKGWRAARSLLNPRPAGRSLAEAALLCALVVALVVFAPELARTGARRVLTPLAEVSWPKRTGVIDATRLVAHPKGAAVPLRALLTRSDRPAADTDVIVRYRLLDVAGEAPVQRALLTPQGKRHAVASGAGDVSGDLFERLIDLDVPAGAPGLSPRLEYWFETSDDRTPAAQVLLVDPPAVAGASGVVTPPAYAAGAEAFVSGTRDLGPGRDERAAVSPVLAGSRVELRLELNKPVPLPDGKHRATRDSLARVFPGVDLPADIEATSSGPRWSITWTAGESVRLPLVLTDSYAISSVVESAYTFQVNPDRAPTVVVAEPAQDESVLATAVLDASIAADDDVGLRGASMEAQIAKPPAGSAGAPAEPVGEASTIASARPDTLIRQLRVPATIDLSTLDLRVGDEVRLTGVATDIFEAEGKPREPTRSAVRRLRIISETQLIEQVRTDLASVRQSALRADEDQKDIAARGAGDPAATARQDALTQRLSPMRDTIDRLSRRVDRNALGDRELRELLDLAANSVRGASDASAQASRALQAAQRAESDDARAQAQDAAAQSQKDVRDELSGLASLLDQGQDTWAVRRQLERLIEDQKQVMTETDGAGRDTAGKSAGELSPEERARLESLAGQQRDLSRRAQQLTDDLEEKSRQQKSDPARGESLREAAERARREGVAEEQRKAAEDIQRNRTRNAQDSQQKALDSLQQMQQDMDNAQAKRDETLRRAADELAGAIDALIASQERELARLGSGESGLDGGMIDLNTRTIALSTSTREKEKDFVPVADLLDAAASSQTGAITALRAAPADKAQAEHNEKLALDRLRQAKAEADRIAKEAEERGKQRQRGELKNAYRDALSAQTTLRDDTAPHLGKELDRRARALVRGLGTRQEELRASLADLRTKSEGLDEASMFVFAHERMDKAAASAAKSLRDGEPSPRAGSDQNTIVRVLASLVEALTAAENEQKFRNQNTSDGGGGGGGGGGGNEPLVPPIAQLRLLRAMQLEAIELTRAAQEKKASLEDAALLQDELARKAGELMEQLMSGQNEQPPGPRDMPNQFDTWLDTWRQPPADAPKPETPKPAEDEADPLQDAKKDEPKKDEPPTLDLDELLGLPKSDRPPGATDPAKENLDEALEPEGQSEAFSEAIDLMRRSAARISKGGDVGIDTQRLQQDAVRRLDQLIAAAQQNAQRRQQKQQQQQQEQQQQQQQSQREQQQRSQAKGQEPNSVNSPGRQDGPGNAAPAPGATWGSLPDRVRQALTEGLSDRFSSMYRSLTEDYYRRLAEQPGSGKPDNRGGNR